MLCEGWLLLFEPAFESDDVVGQGAADVCGIVRSLKQSWYDKAVTDYAIQQLNQPCER